MTEFIWGVRIWLAKEFMRSEKKQKFKKRIFFHSLEETWHPLFASGTFVEVKAEKKKKEKLKKKIFSIYFNLEHELFEWNLHGCMCKSKTKFFKVKKIFQSWKNFKHCIYFKTLYLFRDIVFSLRHCIHFDTMNLFGNIVFISRHSIYFETLYSFRDIIFMPSKRIYLYPLKMYGESARLFFLWIRGFHLTIPYHTLPYLTLPYLTAESSWGRWAPWIWKHKKSF